MLNSINGIHHKILHFYEIEKQFLIETGIYNSIGSDFEIGRRNMKSCKFRKYVYRVFISLARQNV